MMSKRFFRSELFFLLLLIPAAILAYAFVVHQINLKYENAMHLARRHKINLDINQVIPPPLPDEQNASQIIMEAIEEIMAIDQTILESGGSNYQQMFAIFKEAGSLGFISPADIDRLQPLVRPYEPGMQLFYKGLKLDKARYDLNFKNCIDEFYFDLGNRRRVSYIHRAKSLNAMKQKQTAEAVQATIDSFHFAYLTMEENPYITCINTAVELGLNACATLHQLENTIALSQEDRRVLREKVQRILKAERMVECIENEATYWFNHETQVMEKYLKTHTWSRLFYEPYVKANHAEGIEYYAKVLPYYRNYTTEQYKELEQVTIDQDIPPWANLLNNGSSQIFKALRFREQFRATCQLAILSLHILDYKEKNGRYPDTLSQLGPAVSQTLLKDPFTCQPFRYEKKASGALLYSIGPDLIDEHGKQQGEIMTGDFEGDIAWTLPSESAGRVITPSPQVGRGQG